MADLQSGLFYGDGKEEPTNWIRREKIRRGFRSIIYVGLKKNDPTEKKVAVKRLTMLDDDDEEHRNNLLTNITTSMSLEHRRIVKCFGFNLNNKEMSVFSTFMELGSLRDYIHSKQEKRLGESEASLFTYQILEGISYLHEIGLVHRNLSDCNILLEDKSNIRLADIAICELTSNDSGDGYNYKCEYFGAPEMMSGEMYDDKKADIWRVGCVVHYMATGHNVENGNKYSALIKLHQLGSKALTENLQNCSPSLQEFVDVVCKSPPNERPTAIEAMKHDFVKDKNHYKSNTFDELENKDTTSSQTPLMGPFYGDGKHEPTNWIRCDVIEKNAKNKIYTAKKKNDIQDKLFAVKQTTINDDVPDKTKHELLKEITAMQSLDHPRIIQYFGSSVINKVHTLFIGYMPMGSLATYVKSMKTKRLSEDKASLFTYQILDGLSYLHQKGIMHRDIKGGNILLEDENNIRLSDFGLSKILDKLSMALTTGIGTYHWMAPEMFQENENYNNKIDVWSLGITVYCMVVGKTPFKTYESQVFLKLMSERKLTVPTPKQCSKSLQDFIAAACKIDPTERLSALELMSHDFVKDRQRVYGEPHATEITGDVRSRILTEEEICRFGSALGENWERFLLVLGFSLLQVNVEKENCGHRVQTTISRCLAMWYRKNRDRATYQFMMEALIKARDLHRVDVDIDEAERLFQN